MREGDDYVVNGSKMFITNAETATLFNTAAKTDPDADAAAQGHQLFAPKRAPAHGRPRASTSSATRASRRARSSSRTAPCPRPTSSAAKKATGFKQVLAGLEVGRDQHRRTRGRRRPGPRSTAAIRYSQQRQTFGKPICEHQAIQLKLADMATEDRGGRASHLVRQAATKKDRGERCDLEAGMAKLFASETCQEVSLEAMRVFGGYGYIEGVPGRALLPGRAADDDRRGHERDPAHDHRPPADRAERL